MSEITDNSYWNKEPYWSDYQTVITLNHCEDITKIIQDASLYKGTDTKLVTNKIILYEKAENYTDITSASFTNSNPLASTKTLQTWRNSVRTVSFSMNLCWECEDDDSRLLMKYCNELINKPYMLNGHLMIPHVTVKVMGYPEISGVMSLTPGAKTGSILTDNDNEKHFQAQSFSFRITETR